MTLREMRAKYPDAFYPNQDWFNGEAFMDVEARPWIGWPDRVDPFTLEPWEDSDYTAADLAALWLEDTTRRIWIRYLWTADLDILGQRIYVGQNGRGFEIHRHLHLTDRWGVPV